MKLFLRVTLCIIIIAFSISLPQRAPGMPLWQHAAICYLCSNPSVAITQIGITCIMSSPLAESMRHSALRCLSHPSGCARVLLVPILVYLMQLVVIFGRDCAAAYTLYLSRQILTKTSSSSSQSRLFPCFQRGSHSAGKPHNFRADVTLRGTIPPVSKTRHVHVSHTTWPTRVPYYVCRVCFFGPPYPSDCTGDDSATCPPRALPIPHDVLFPNLFGPAYPSDYSGDGPPAPMFVYSSPPRDPYRAVWRAFSEPSFIKALRHPRHIHEWLCLFLRIARRYQLCQKMRRERLLLRRSWLCTLHTALSYLQPASTVISAPSPTAVPPASSSSAGAISATPSLPRISHVRTKSSAGYCMHASAQLMRRFLQRVYTPRMMPTTHQITIMTKL